MWDTNDPANYPDQPSMSKAETMMIPVPVVWPLGWTVDKKAMVKEVWDVFIRPDQEAGIPPSIETRMLMAILRAVYEGTPE